MKTKTFDSLMKEFQYRYDTRQVFNDFLTLSICAFGQDYATGKSKDEDLYMTTIAKYKDEKLSDKFPELLSLLIMVMEERVGSGMGNDVLCEFYETNLYSKGKSQYFTPWPVCKFMAAITMLVDAEEMAQIERPLRVIDPCCGSGRMLLAGATESKQRYEYYGIDIDYTCVQMAALNLFLNGMFNSEVMCANALDPDDFRQSFRISFFPLGIYRITEKEESMLWHLQRNSFKKTDESPKPFVKAMFSSDGSQLQLF
jgi:type I restriction-modification system DNA methylase subunit